MLLSLIFSLLLTHPLDNGPYSNIDFSAIEKNICNNKIYLSPINGTIESINLINNKYTIKISNENIDIILVGLDEIYNKVGDVVITGSELGKDNDITIYTKFINIQYNQSDIFPQFYNNKLYFNAATQGLPIYSMSDGVVSIINFDAMARGSYIQIINFSKAIIIEYWHNLSFNVRIGQIIEKNQKICYLGNTGIGYEPHLTVSILDNIYDYKAIYIRNKIIETTE